jgi:hypothetical protein
MLSHDCENHATVLSQDLKRSSVQVAVPYMDPSVPQPVRQIPLMGFDSKVGCKVLNIVINPVTQKFPSIKAVLYLLLNGFLY